jgi:hypothetical protein
MEALAHSDTDQIMVPCGSCFYFLKEGYSKLFPDDETVKAFTQKIVEPSAFFLPGWMRWKRKGCKEHRPAVNLSDPTSKGMLFQGTSKATEITAAALEMKGRIACDGRKLQFYYYDLSKILKHKLDDIEDGG